MDDSKATNVESTLTGLKGLKEHNAVVLLGGVAKVTLVWPSTHNMCFQQNDFNHNGF